VGVEATIVRRQTETRVHSQELGVEPGVVIGESVVGDGRAVVAGVLGPEPSGFECAFDVIVYVTRSESAGSTSPVRSGA
jgi:hypothetical protein